MPCTEGECCTLRVPLAFSPWLPAVTPAANTLIHAVAHAQLAQAKAEDALEATLGFPMFTNGDDRLGWLMNIQQVSMPLCVCDCVCVCDCTCVLSLVHAA